MKRGRPSKITQALAVAKRVPAVSAPTGQTDLTDPRLVALTARFRELQHQAFRDLVGAAVELGQLVVEGRSLVGDRYAEWLDQLGVSRKSADNYMSTYMLAKKHPEVIERWKELGPTKLYQVARLPDGAHREVLQPKKREEILQMNDREFTAMVAPHLPKSRVTVSPAQKASGLRQKAASWRTQLGEFRKYFAKHIPEERPKELEAELRALKKAVDEILAAW